MSHKASLACAGAFAAAAALTGISPAFSHTIVGDPVFPATLTIDDPGENDEFVMPSFAYTAAANPDGTLGPLTYGFDWEYSKTISYNLAFSVGSSFIHQVNPSATARSGPRSLNAKPAANPVRPAPRNALKLLPDPLI
jgi:hypothetical protein